MNIQKIFLLSCTFVASMNYVHASAICGRTSPGGLVNDSTPKKSGDGLPSVKDNRRVALLGSLAPFTLFTLALDSKDEKAVRVLASLRKKPFR